MVPIVTEATEFTRWIEVTDGGVRCSRTPRRLCGKGRCDCGPCRPHHRPCKGLAGTHRMWPMRTCRGDDYTIIQPERFCIAVAGLPIP
jgi:hypothetical protein